MKKMSNQEVRAAQSMFGINNGPQKKEPVWFRLLVQFFKLVQMPAKFLRQRTVAKARAERRKTRLNILAGLNVRLVEVDTRIDALIRRSVIEKIDLDPEIQAATNHKLYLEGQIQRYS